MTKEATARVKINKLLDAAGWRFFADGNDAANIRLEPSVTIKSFDLDALVQNFEKIERGFVDFLLLGRTRVRLEDQALISRRLLCTRPTARRNTTLLRCELQTCCSQRKHTSRPRR